MTLSHEDTIRAGEAAWKTLQEGGEDFNNWVKVGRALAVLRDDAQRRAGNHTGRFFNKIMGPLLKQHGFDQINSATRSHLLAVVDRYDEVMAWRRALTTGERLRYNHPATIIRRCPIFHPPVNPNVPMRPSPMATMKASNIELQEKLHEKEEALKRANSGGNFSRNDLDRDIVTMIAQEIPIARRLRIIAQGLIDKAKTMEKKEP